MFFPMSWTSPLTVAVTSLPRTLTLPDAFFSACMNGSRYATARFIARALFTTCGRNILPAPNRSPTTFMPSINGPSMTISGLAYFFRASSVSASMNPTSPCSTAYARRSDPPRPAPPRVCEPLFDGALAPGKVDLPFRAASRHVLGEFHQALGGIRPSIEDDVFDQFEQVLRDVLINDQLAGVDDAHVEARLDRVIQKCGVHGLAHPVVATEGERQVGNAARDAHPRAFLLDLGRGFDERLRVTRVLLDPRRDGEDVGVEDDVFRVVAGLLGEQLVCPLADADLALERVRLTLFVEGHHDHPGAILADQPGLFEEGLLAFLEADRVAHAFALQALEGSLEDGTTRAVDHDRDARDLGLGGDEVEEAGHRGLGIEQVGVHVHVEHVRATAHLVQRHLHGAREVARLDQSAEPDRARDVGPLADDDEPGVRSDLEWLQAAELRLPDALGDMAGRDAGHRLADLADVIGRGAAAPAGGVEEATGGELAQEPARDRRGGARRAAPAGGGRR